MNSAHSITFAAVMVSGAIIGWQALENCKLERETHDLARSIQVAMGPEGPIPSRSKRTSAKSEGADRPAIAFPVSLKEILANRDPMERIRGLLAYVESLPSEQIGEALEELRAGSPDWDPQAKFLAHMLLTRWGQEHPEAAFASLKNMDFRRSGGDATSILASVAAIDPQRAVAWLNDPDNNLQHLPKMGHVLAGTIAKEWVRQDSGAALAWADQLPEDQRRGALSGVIESLASTNPEVASDMVMGMDSDRERHEFIGEIAQSWGRQNPRPAMEWAQSLEGKERREAVEEILDGWAQSEPADAAAYVDSLPPDERTEAQISEIAREWARRDPAQTAQWLDTQPIGEGRQSSMGELMWNWTSLDPQGASSWLAEQPAGESRDIGAAALAKAALNNDPEGAVAWAFTIGNEEMRGEMLERGLDEWSQRDASAAAAWAAQNGVTLPESD